MKRHVWICTLILILFFNAEARSELTSGSLICTDIKPSVESGGLSRDTVIETTLSYSINLKKLKKKKYFITILFESSEGPNSLFNKSKTRLGDAEHYLDKISGTVKLKYPMDAVWNDMRLKRPVSIVFFIMEHGKNGSRQAIATAGPFIFRSIF